MHDTRAQGLPTPGEFCETDHPLVQTALASIIQFTGAFALKPRIGEVHMRGDLG